MFWGRERVDRNDCVRGLVMELITQWARVKHVTLCMGSERYEAIPRIEAT